MNTSIQESLNALIAGSTLLGTGGGGSPVEARKTYETILKSNNKFPQLQYLNEFPDEGIFVTAFTVGSVSNDEDASEAIQRAFAELSSYLKKEIIGIVPVEIGPHCVAKAFYLASVLDVPVLDADFVGGRSAPEVFLETITLFEVPRTPAAVANVQGDAALLLNATSPQKEEEFFRNFARLTGTGAQVVGYPVTKKQIQQSVECGTVSQAIQVGESLLQSNVKQLIIDLEARTLYEGKIERIDYEEDSAFTICTVEMKNDSENASLYIKNENLILWIDNEPVATCPDLIMLLDENNVPVYNGDLKEGMNVCVLAAPARPLWRTAEGIALFSPKLFGFDIQPQLMNT